MKRLVIFLAIAAALAGCVSPNRDAPTLIDAATGHIKTENSHVRTNAQAIVSSAKRAKGGMDAIVTTIPASSQASTGVVYDSLRDIHSRADQILVASTRIETETKTLYSTLQQVDQMQAKIKRLEQSLSQARLDALKKLYTYISMFWIIGFIIIAGGVALSFFVNKTMGFTLMIVGAIMLAFASAAQYYLEQIAQVGAFLLVGMVLSGVGIMVWSMIRAKQTSTAVREIVEMMEILKESMLEDERERIFGKDGIASRVQSDITKEVIAKVKEKNGFYRLAELRKEAGLTSDSDLGNRSGLPFSSPDRKP
jgi:hypothetical protein